MKREEHDNYRLRTKTGKFILYGAYIYDKCIKTYEEAKLLKDKMGEPDVVICHEEVYKYFDDNGNFISEERTLTVVEQEGGDNNK